MCGSPELQAMMLHRIHTADTGATSNLRLAKEFLFWPGMVKAIEDMCNMCGMCAQYPTATPRAPMKSLPIPRVPFEMVSQDLFAYKGKPYLVTVCHFTDWIEYDELSDTLSSTIVAATRFGIPTWVSTDNGPQFFSRHLLRPTVSLIPHLHHIIPEAMVVLRQLSRCAKTCSRNVMTLI